MTPLRALVLDCRKLLTRGPDALPWSHAVERVVKLLEGPQAIAALAADEATGWQPIATAPQHVQYSATAFRPDDGRGRTRWFYDFSYGADYRLYALYCSGLVGSSADWWMQMPTLPLPLPAAPVQV